MQVFELTYEQRHFRAGNRRPQISEISAGFVRTEAEAIAHKSAAPGHGYHAAELDAEEAWMLGV